MMKHFFSVGIAFVVLSVSCSKTKHTQEQNPSPKHQHTKKEISSEKMHNFFSRSLKGESISFEGSSPLEINQISEAQKNVWLSWRQANESFSEEKLPILSPMGEKKSESWQLPQHLEPNATMHFFFGKYAQKPLQGYPLFLYLHGSGNPQDEWEAGWHISSYYPNEAGVHFVPKIPNGYGDYYRWYKKSKQFAWEKLLRLAYLSQEIDPNRIFFYGVSEGGYGSQRLASFYADYLAGAGPMAGGEPLINAPVENCRNIAFFFLTGEKDFMFHRNKLTEYAKEEFEKFHSQDPQGWIHNIRLEPNAGHGVPYRKAFAWLKDFQRNPYPKKVLWEDFPMDEVYRKGFYNIVVNERTSERTRYSMEIVNNKINVEVDQVTYHSVEKSPNWGFTTKYQKNYTPLTKGKFTIYLNNQLVDLTQEVEVIVNGKSVFKGILKPDMQHLINSCAVFFDPERLYPVAVKVVL